MGDISFYDLLPPNLNDAESRALSYAFDCQFKKLHAYIPTTMLYADIMSAEEWVCDYLALMLDIRVYDMSLPLDTKRRLIQTARKNSSKKGTAKAVSDVIGTIHDGASLIPWFAYNGEPYKFRIAVDTSERGMGVDDYDKLESSIDEYKALRSQLEAITVTSKAAGKHSHGGVVVSGESVKIMPYIKNTLQSAFNTVSAGACISGEYTVIKMMRTEA